MTERAERLRRDYAARIVRLAGVADARIEEAFAAVPRERFCGPPPWRVSGPFGLSAGESDVASLYDDVLVAIDARRGINNGQPSLHAACIDAMKLEAGDTVLQIGAGTGYYTAILARLVGPSGRVLAYEIESDIAEVARQNLAHLPQVEVKAASGVAAGLPNADAIYANAAASHPLEAWLDALKAGGRLLFPLQAEHSTGAMLLVQRPSEARNAWPAKLMNGVVFIGCKGGQDLDVGRRLDRAFQHGGARRVGWLRRGAPRADEKVWLEGDGWALIEGEESGEGP
jgi:protein-L-isoaspartate(D-aspartate) O-methyltransferase